MRPSLWINLLLVAASQGCLRELIIVDEDEGGDVSTEMTSDDDGCTAAQLECDGACVDASSDVAHCGACGVVCLAGQICVLGECETEAACGCDEARELCVDGTCECRLGFERCADSCVDTRTDVAHCGGCDQPCAGACVGGSCVASCEAPRVTCGTSCVDLSSDPLHCEECGDACDADEACVAGQCRDVSLAGCASCPCDCGEGICCESAQLDAVLCVRADACPP